MNGMASTLSFAVVDAKVEAYAAVPTIQLRLRISDRSGAPVHAVALRCQIRIEPQRRQYSSTEEDRLYEMFGEPPQWGSSLRPFLWTHVGTTITSFVGSTEVDLPITCTYDFEVAAAKYLHALDDGEVPLLLLFSGTMFVKGSSGFSAEPVPWNQEATYRLPVQVWRDVMDLYFPDSGWVRLSRDTINTLQRYKAERALPSWNEALEQLLNDAGKRRR